MHEDTRIESPVAEGPYRVGEWDECPNVKSLCPACLGRIRPRSCGIHGCKCTDILWRRHPLARGPKGTWQVMFLDDVLSC